MEVSLQPSFTFPSRKVYANRALGLQAQINLQQLTSVPKQATDINLETSFYPTLTVPKSIEKESIDVPPVLPVVEPVYVQPGLAEGLSGAAASQQFDKMILTTTSANNALKRGNYKAAENILGRPLSVEEIQNHTVTPQARQTEQSGQKVHVGNHTQAVGAPLRPGGSKHENELAFRTANSQFVGDLAAAFGITPAELERMKLGNQYVGSIDFSAYGRSNDLAERKRTLQKYIDYLRDMGMRTVGERKQSEDEKKQSAQAQWEDMTQRSQANNAEIRARQQDEFKRARDIDEDMKESRWWQPGEDWRDPRTWHDWEGDNDTRGPSLSPDEEMKDPASRPIEEDDVNPGVREMVINNIPLPGQIFLKLREESPSAALNALARASFTYYKSRMNAETHRKFMLLLEANEALVAKLARSEAKAETVDADMSPEQVADAVLNAPKGSESMDQREADRGKRSKSDEFEEKDTKRRKKGKVEIEDVTGMDENEWGEGFGKQKHRKKRRNVRFAIDDRWVPDAEGFYAKGAPVSGNYMRKTGTDAIPISAQLQVQETHQLNELPVRKFTQFPNMQEETKTDPIPIAQNTQRGVGAHKGKVPFGRYKIDLGKLMGEGVLSLSHPNGRKVHGFPNHRVSKGVHHALSQLVTGGKVSPRRLASEDKVFMTSLLRRSHANVPAIGADVNMPPEEQLQLILGEMAAGNDSAQLKAQLKKLLPYMCRVKLITPQHKAEITAHYL